MPRTVYIETSIISYLTARPRRDVIGAARQQLTVDWWDKQRSGFELFVSSVVEDEASRGDNAAAARRLAEIKDLPRLAATAEVNTFARQLIPAQGIARKGP